jgi:phosphoglycerate dehydrogenase-like enzyme
MNASIGQLAVTGKGQDACRRNHLHGHSQGGARPGEAAMTPVPAGRAAPRILVLAPDPGAIAARIARAAPAASIATCTGYPALAQTLARARPEVAFVFKIGAQPFPRQTLLSAPSLRWVQNAGAGIDHLAPWDAGALTVTNAAGAHGTMMGQHTIWAILNQQLGLPAYAEQQGRRIWQQRGRLPVAGQTLVIVGFGTIGAEIGRLARAIGMRVIGVRARPRPSDAADEVLGPDRLHEALGRGDYISIVLPKTPATRNLFDARAIAAMKPGAYLVNTGRGGIVDEDALLCALRSGHLSGALLDVFAVEPLPPDHPLWQAPNTLILPHATGDAGDWKERVTAIFCANLENWMAGRPLFNICDPQRGY